MTEPEAYEMPEDGFDICEACNYLEPVAATITADGLEPLRPLCLACATELGEI